MNKNEDVRNQNNFVEVEGVIDSTPEYHHSVYGEKIYSFFLRISRLNPESFDVVRVEISDRLTYIDELEVGSAVHITGQFRSFNKIHDDGKRSLELSIFAQEIQVYNSVDYENSITLDGYVCKDVIYRTTPMGREIGDILLAVNRNYGKSDYIPCIAWGRNARFAESLAVGSNVHIAGRVQSRKYIKKLDDGSSVQKTAYEVSISKIELVDEKSEE